MEQRGEMTTKLRKHPAFARFRKLERDLSIYNLYQSGIKTSLLAKNFEMTVSQVCKIIRQIEAAKLKDKANMRRALVRRALVRKRIMSRGARADK